jgi:hypothetical protein
MAVVLSVGVGIAVGRWVICEKPPGHDGSWLFLSGAPAQAPYFALVERHDPDHPEERWSLAKSMAPDFTVSALPVTAAVRGSVFDPENAASNTRRDHPCNGASTSTEVVGIEGRPGVLLTVACDGVLERYRYTVDGRHIRLVSAVKYSQLGPFVAIALGAFASVVIAAAALVFLRLAKGR